MATDFRHTSPKALDPLEFMFRYHTSAKGIPIPGEDNVIVRQRQKFNLETHLIPASWSQVLLIAFLYSLGIFWVRIVYIDLFGRPTIFAYNHQIETEYKNQHATSAKASGTEIPAP